VPEWKEYAEQQLWLLQKSVRRLSELGVQILTITNLSLPKIKELKRTKRLTFLSIMMIIKRLQKLLGCCQSNRHVHNFMQEFQKIFRYQQVS
jgi:hypothetical protein